MDETSCSMAFYLRNTLHKLSLLYKSVGAVDISATWVINKKKPKRTAESILEEIRKMDRKGLIDSEKVIKMLGYESDSTTELLDMNVSPRGYRVLNKIPKMPASVIEKIIDAFGSLQIVCNATVAQLDDVDGIGERRAKIINQSLKRLQEQNILKLYNI